MKGRSVEMRKDTQDASRMVVRIPGRCSFDLEIWLQKNLKLRSFGLVEAAVSFLGRQLVLPADDDAAATSTLDLLLEPHPKNRVFMALNKDMAYANVTGAQLADVLIRGTQFVLLQRLLREAEAGSERYIFPDAVREYSSTKAVKRTKREHTIHDFFGGEMEDAEEEEEDDSGVAFKGGKVLPAKPGLYVDPVLVFDFASLYTGFRV